MRAPSARRDGKDDKYVETCLRARDHKRWLRCERIQLWHEYDRTVRYDICLERCSAPSGHSVDEIELRHDVIEH
ncbi:hypothetical protein M6B38_258150 [Iris pallida]|uniref:Uncharacterized protein n=1 Tax=Iris pallida TaxID=29817 RepID=A0AAX6IG18_IRIPA|nr:hypothetical protein M6B38_258150 [Iris pallida]